MSAEKAPSNAMIGAGEVETKDTSSQARRKAARNENGDADAPETYWFPTLQISITAGSQEEANEKAAQIIKERKSN